MVTINVDTPQTIINAKVNDITINVKIGAGISSQNASYVNSDTSFAFNGSGGDTYLVYDSNSSRLQLYVNGNLENEWG